jgi:hypothetical protein
MLAGGIDLVVIESGKRGNCVTCSPLFEVAALEIEMMVESSEALIDRFSNSG